MTNTVTIQANGPIVVEGQIEIIDAEQNVLARESYVEFCRCGQSKTKPYCDQTHASCGFREPGFAGKEVQQPVTVEQGALQVLPNPNGSLKLFGPCEIRTTDGKMSRVERVSLCRCGRSKVKPYCDSSHKETGFEG